MFHFMHLSCGEKENGNIIFLRCLTKTWVSLMLTVMDYLRDNQDLLKKNIVRYLLLDSIYCSMWTLSHILFCWLWTWSPIYYSMWTLSYLMFETNIFLVVLLYSISKIRKFWLIVIETVLYIVSYSFSLWYTGNWINYLTEGFLTLQCYMILTIR